MTILAPNEVAYIVSRLWSDCSVACIEVGIAVPYGESKFDTEAQGRSTTGAHIGNRDLGLYQISNKFHYDKLKGRNWRDPWQNATIAREIFDNAGGDVTGADGLIKGWKPWAVYNSGAYKNYLPDAKIALLQILPPPEYVRSDMGLWAPR